MSKWLILFVTFLTNLGYASTEVIFEIVPNEKGDSPVYVVFQGERFDPPKPLERRKGEEIDHSSPASVLEEFLGAAFEGDSERHKQLFAPGEQTQSFLAPGSAGREIKAAIKANLQYGEFTISILDVQGTLWPQVTKLVNRKHYFSDALNNADRAYELFESSFLGNSPARFSDKVRSDLKGLVSEKIRPLDDPEANRSFEILYTGTIHTPPRVLKNPVEEPGQDLKTPDEAILATYSAALANDTEWYLRLISPEELDSDERYLGGNTIRRYVNLSLEDASKSLKVREVAIERTIRFGNYAIFIFSGDRNEARGYLAFKNQSGKWLLTDDLNGNGLVNYFCKDEINAEAVFPRVLF